MASNGQLPDSELMAIPGGRLRTDAAKSWIRLRNHVGKEAGVWLCPTSSRTAYRTLAEQQYFWNLYTSGHGNLAARPGTSNHGWGTTVDLPTPQMRALIDRYGAPYGFSKTWSDAPSEWWHIRYDPGHDTHKGEPLEPRKPDVAYLTDDEATGRRRLLKLRRQARQRGKWDWDPDRLAYARKIKSELRTHRKRIRAAADKDGWQKNRRRERYRALGHALNGKGK